MSAYLKKLACAVADENRASAPTPAKRVEEWFAKQPEISRHRPYSMQEIEIGTGIAARFLGELLISQGWKRRRQWSSKTSYRRFWTPPIQRDDEKFNLAKNVALERLAP